MYVYNNKCYYLFYIKVFFSNKYINIFRKRLLSLAAQKFIADIATDAFQHSKIRQQNTALKAKGGKVYFIL